MRLRTKFNLVLVIACLIGMTTASYFAYVAARNFEAWEADGSKDAAQRANGIWKKILAEFQPPPMDEAVREELAAFVARRVAEGGAPTDF